MIKFDFYKPRDGTKQNWGDASVSCILKIMTFMFDNRQ